MVPARRINVLFSVILAPLIFTGSVQFPFLGLADLRVFQVVCALNPLTYISEGVRASLVPGVPHLPLWLCLLVATGAIVLHRHALRTLPGPLPVCDVVVRLRARAAVSPRTDARGRR